MRSLARWAMGLALFSAVGCTFSGHGTDHTSATTAHGESGSGQAIEQVSARAGRDSGVEVHAIRYDELDPMVRRYHGKVVVVDFWLFHCKPCKAGFPYLLQLHQKYGSHGVVVLAVNLDDPANTAVREKALAFLKQTKANFTNVVLADGEHPEQWVTMRSDPARGVPGFVGEFPFTEVYDRKGGLALHEVGVDHDVLDEFVQKLLIDGMTN
jgi:thiol-disulfide isomerase/thioredoxin